MSDTLLKFDLFSMILTARKQFINHSSWLILQDCDSRPRRIVRIFFPFYTRRISCRRFIPFLVTFYKTWSPKSRKQIVILFICRE